jgi:hypothetical protein
MAHVETTSDSKLSELESSVARLEERVAELESRLSTLITTGTVRLTTMEAALPSAVQPRRDSFDISLVGRSLIALGGAYLLRALTESRAVPPAAGIALGFAYAIFWAGMIDRAARRGRRMNAIFDGVLVCIIGYPMIWEATASFHILDANSAAISLAVLFGIQLYIAHRRQLQPVAWFATAGALGAGVVLVFSTSIVIPFAVVLTALAVATLWLSYTRDWWILPWLPAVVIDAMLLALILLSVQKKTSHSTAAVVSLLFAVFAAFLVTMSFRKFIHAESVTFFELLQMSAGAFIAFGGALLLTRTSGASDAYVGSMSLTFAAISYACSFFFLFRRPDWISDLLFFSSIAVVLTMLAASLLMAPGIESFIFGVLAIGSLVLGAAWKRIVLSVQGMVYAIAAAVASGLLWQTTQALVFPPRDEWPWLTLNAAAMLALAIGAALIPVLDENGFWESYVHVPRVGLAALVGWCGAGAVSAIVVPLIAGRVGPELFPGVGATIHTAILGLLAIGFAWLGRTRHFADAAMLVYPVLVIGGLKLLVEDFRLGRAVTLFIGLALFGGSIVLVSWIRRSAVTEATAEAPAPTE